MISVEELKITFLERKNIHRMSNLPIDKMKSKAFKHVLHEYHVIKIYINIWSSPVNYKEKSRQKKNACENKGG